MRHLPYFLITLMVFAVAVGCQDSGSRTPARTTEPADGTGPRGSFVFTAAGDYGSSRATTATLDLIARSDAGFNLALGDLIPFQSIDIITPPRPPPTKSNR